MPIRSSSSHSKKDVRYYIRLFSLPLLLSVLSETALSYMFPILVIDQGLSNSMLGLILGASAVIGLLTDFFLPQFLRNIHWKHLLTASIVFVVLFPVTTLSAIFLDVPILFLLASFFWYIHFELSLFSQQSFIVSISSKQAYSQNWGSIIFITQISAIVGPIIASLLLGVHHIYALFGVICISIINLLLLIIVLKKLPSSHTPGKFTAVTPMNLLKEISLYSIIGKSAGFLVIFIFFVIFMQEMFWNYGGLLGETYQHTPGVGWMIIAAFTISQLIGPFVLTRLSLRQHKKKTAIISLLLSGILLSTIAAFDNFIILVGIVFISGIFSSFATPLYESVVSDLTKRVSHFKLSFISFFRFTSSISYIIAPVSTGFIADAIGYKSTFALTGILVAVVSLLLFILIPNKIHLRQKEIKHYSP